MIQATVQHRSRVRCSTTAGRRYAAVGGQSGVVVCGWSVGCAVVSWVCVFRANIYKPLTLFSFSGATFFRLTIFACFFRSCVNQRMNAVESDFSQRFDASGALVFLHFFYAVKASNKA